MADTVSADGITVDATDIFQGGFSIELKNGGRAVATINGETGSMKWTLDGDQFSAKDSESEVTGTLADGELTLVNVMNSGVDFHLVKQDAAK